MAELKKRTDESGIEGDTVLVLGAVGAGIMSAVTAAVALVEILDYAPRILALEVAAAIAIFGAIIMRAMIQRLNSTPDRYRAHPPVVPMTLRRRQAG